MATAQGKRYRKEVAQRDARGVSVNEAAREEHALDKGFTARKIDYTPKTQPQSEFLNAIRTSEISVGIGPAGVGKTFTAATVAAQMLLSKKVDGIILTRANVTLGNSIGMLPGTVEEKMTPLLMPIIEVLKRQLGVSTYEYFLRKGQIQMLPIEYVRGMSFINKFVLCDESQNLEVPEVQALVTRYESGRIVLMGDPQQHDLKGEPGISWLEKFAKRHDIKIPISIFGVDDIVRHPLVKAFIVGMLKDQEAKKAKPRKPKAEPLPTLDVPVVKKPRAKKTAVLLQE